MWVEWIVENSEQAVVYLLLGYTAVRDIWNALPMNSIRKLFAKSENNIVGSNKVVFSKFNDGLKKIDKVVALVQEERLKDKEVIAKKDAENAVLTNTIVALLPYLNAPINAKKSFYEGIKSLDVINDSLKSALEISIEAQEQVESSEVENDDLDTLIDQEV